MKIESLTQSFSSSHVAAFMDSAVVNSNVLEAFASTTRDLQPSLELDHVRARMLNQMLCTTTCDARCWHSILRTTWRCSRDRLSRTGQNGSTSSLTCAQQHYRQTLDPLSPNPRPSIMNPKPYPSLLPLQGIFLVVDYQGFSLSQFRSVLPPLSPLIWRPHFDSRRLQRCPS